MYQLMQESLAANIVDHSLPSHMCTACWKALDKVKHYYDMAKLNHFSILAMSKYSQSASRVWHNTHTHSQFCILCYNYPGLSQSTMMLMSVQKRYWNTTIPNMQRQCPLQLHLHCPMSPLLHQITHSWPALLVASLLVPSLYLPVSSLSIEGGILSESQLVCWIIVQTVFKLVEMFVRNRCGIIADSS